MPAYCVLDVPLSRNVVYPWLSDVVYLASDGALRSTIAGGSMSLALSDSIVICLVSTPTLTVTPGTVYNSSFSSDVSVSFSLGGVVRPCPINGSLTTASMVCCTTPTLQELCGQDTGTDCLSRGE